MLGALQLRLVYASNSMEDVLMKLHLDAMAAGYYGKFKVGRHSRLESSAIQSHNACEQHAPAGLCFSITAFMHHLPCLCAQGPRLCKYVHETASGWSS